MRLPGTVYTQDSITEDVSISCDVCIVGSGAGGSVLAAGLAEQGLDVVMLEAGGALMRPDYLLKEDQSFPRLYQERGGRSTDDLGITILQGRTLGGGTTINWTTCFRTPQRIQAHWAEHHGVSDLGLDPHFASVEQRLNVSDWPGAAANPNNKALSRGCEALGIEWGALRRNVKGCANSGYCGFGCPVDGKQAMGVTYLQDALKAGMRLYTNAPVRELVTDGARVTEVRAQVQPLMAAAPSGPTVTVRPKVCVVSGGAINTPGLLLRSGITAGGRVGKRTFLHPVVAVMGRYDDPINPWYGAPQSIGSHHFIDRGPDKVGYFLEAAPIHPVMGALSVPMWGAEMSQFMRQMAHVSGLIALSVDGLLPGDEGGQVYLDGTGRPRLKYEIGPHLHESFHHAHKTLARIHLAAGANLAASLHVSPAWISSESELGVFDELPYGSHEHTIFSAHQMGGCAMGADPSTSVVDREHRVRGHDNLFVVDGSVLPTALGVNPSVTIYALAHRAREFVAAAV